MYFFLLVAFYFIKMIMSSLEKNYIYIYIYRKSGTEFLSPLINSISKSKTLKIACQRAKICFDAMF